MTIFAKTILAKTVLTTTMLAKPLAHLAKPLTTAHLLACLFTASISLTATIAHAEADYESAFTQGQKYYLGDSVERNYPRAYEHFGNAARGGHPQAQFYFGLMFNHGYGIVQDYDQARHWFELAAGHGVPGAHHALGNLFHHGYGVQQNHSQALQWYGQAIDFGYQESVDPYAQLYLDGSASNSDLLGSPSLLSQIAASGDVTAQYNMGYMHYIGHKAPQDHKVASNWFLKAALQGDSDSQYNLAKMYYAGEGLKVDFGRCYVWSTLSLQQNHDEAQTIRDQCREKLSEAEVAKLDDEIEKLSSKLDELEAS